MITTNVFKQYIKAFNERKTLIISQGGTSAGKSYAAIQFFIYLLHHPDVKNKTLSCVSESYPHLYRGIFRDFMNIMESEGLYDKSCHNMTNNIYKVGTNTLEFFSVDDESKVRGPRRWACFINEANNIKFDTYRQLSLRTLGFTIIDFNPVQSFWAHSLIDREDVSFIKSTYLDNISNTPQKVIDEINRMKLTDPNWYRVYGLGEIGSLEGLIFNNFTISDFDDNEKKVFGLDWGYTNDSTVLVSVYLKDKTLYVDELLYKNGLTNQDIGLIMEQLGIRKHIDVIYTDSSEPKSSEELSRMGYVCKPAIKGPDSILKGIDVLKSFNIVISKRSVNLIKELRNYQWMKDKDGKYINKPVGIDHAIDALRYATSSHFGIKKSISPPIFI